MKLGISKMWRQLLPVKRLIVLALALVAPTTLAIAWNMHGVPPVGAYNGKLVTYEPSLDHGRQANRLINVLQDSAQEWSHVSTGYPVDVSTENANGFPANNNDLGTTWISNTFIMGNGTATSLGLNTTYIYQIVGTAAVKVNTVSGCPGSSGSCSSVTGTNCTATISGGTVTMTGTNCTVTVTMNAPGYTTVDPTWTISCVGDGATVPACCLNGSAAACPQLTQLSFHNSALDTKQQNCLTGEANLNVQLMQQCFTPWYITEMSDAGAIRHLDDMDNVVGTDDGFVATWEDVSPPTYYAMYEATNVNYYPLSSVTTNYISAPDSSNRVTLTAPNVTTLYDHQHIIARMTSDITLTTATVASSVSSGTTMVLNSLPAGLTTGMTVADNSFGGQNLISPTAVITNINAGTSTITIGCGAYACTTPFFSTVPSGDTIYFGPQISVNGGSYYPLVSATVFPFGKENYGAGPIHAGPSGSQGYVLLVYDAQLQEFLIDNANTASTGANRGIRPGLSPYLAVAMSNATGAHPYFLVPCGPMDNLAANNDYIHKLDVLNQSSLLPGLIPRIEGSDEVWNTRYGCTTMGWVRQYTRTGTNQDWDSWYGAAMSYIGQQVASDYGLTKPDITKYWIIDSVQTIGVSPTKGGGVQDHRLSSTYNGSPAYSWITHVGIAGYYQTDCAQSPSTNITEVALAYVYSQTLSSTLLGYFLNNNGSVGYGSACGVNHTSYVYGLYYLTNVLLPQWANYVASYNTGSPQGAVPLGLTIYEGHYVAGNGSDYAYVSGGNTAPTLTITGFTPGNPTVLAVSADSAADYICNTGSQCGGSGPLTLVIAGSGNIASCNSGALLGNQTVNAASSSTITLNYNSTGCTTGAGTATYYQASTWMPAFEEAVVQDTSTSYLYAYELAYMQSVYSAGNSTSPTIISSFPAIYEFDNSTVWAQYYPNGFCANGPAPVCPASVPGSVLAVRAYNAAP